MAEKVFQPLYTKATNESIRYWTIKVVEQEDGSAKIIREYGQMGGKAIFAEGDVKIGKSKKTPFEQAVFEAQVLWNNQVGKKGYVEDFNRLSNSSGAISQLTATSKPEVVPLINVETIPKLPKFKPLNFAKLKVETKVVPVVPEQIEHTPINAIGTKGTIKAFKDMKFLPMLAQEYLERYGHVKFPCMVQPKLDGVRMIARRNENNEIVFRSRSDKEKIFFDHIRQEVKDLNIPHNVFLDGEFYSRSFPFRTVSGWCNTTLPSSYKAIPMDKLKTMKYNIYDCYLVDDPSAPFEKRYKFLQDNVLPQITSKNMNYIHLVPCRIAENDEQIKQIHKEYIDDKYEGSMIRNTSGKYMLKNRSNDLLKLKDFPDKEYVVVRCIAPETGKEKDLIIYELQTDDGTKFTCRPEGSYEERRSEYERYKANPDDFIGKKYTVKYQDLGEHDVPRFPTGLGLRYDL